MRVRVKLCGVTRLEDALAAVDLGVDALGFNFVDASPRRIEEERARRIVAALPPLVTAVGVFADARPAAMEATARRIGLQALQLHGDETPEDGAALTLPWFKAHRVTPAFQLEDVARYGSGTFLLDAHLPGLKGGTGRTLDWSVARRAAAYGRVILAGGIGPGNVRRAIEAARPYAIDVNSGVESAPGVKEMALLRQLMIGVAGATAEDRA